MRYSVKCALALLLVTLVAGYASAKEKAKPKAKDDDKNLKGGIEGKITEIKENGVIVVHENAKEGAKDFVATTASYTKVEIDGAKGKKVTDLKVGYRVSVKLADGKAREIKATSPSGAKPK